MTARSKEEQLTNRIVQEFKQLENAKITTEKIDVIHRFILLLGRTNSGKTTLRYTLANPTRVSNELCLLSESGTTESEIIKCEKPPISLTIVDTQSLSGNQDDENKLVNIYETLSKRGITRFHLICYCISFDAGIRQQDVDALKNIIDCYGEQIMPNLCMIIMRCESKTDGQRHRIRTELQQDHQFKDIVKQFGQGIQFFGALNYDDWHHGNETVFDQFRVVYNYREKLLQLFCGDVKPCGIQISPKPIPQLTYMTPIDKSLAHGVYQQSVVSQNVHDDNDDMHDRDRDNFDQTALARSCRIWFSTKQYLWNSFNLLKEILQSRSLRCCAFWNSSYNRLLFRKRSYYIMAILCICLPMLCYCFANYIARNDNNIIHESSITVEDSAFAAVDLCDTGHHSPPHDISSKSSRESSVFHRIIDRFLEFCFPSYNSFE
ncbi:unnamed protein product [Rotaria socialis]|uniref:G domain-containing protein n=1 Tax=Rotaria socialis TaxID=392032 RepID=A0A820Q223_9BILA|nr:unnamed protein product [Rotaria socialis]